MARWDPLLALEFLTVVRLRPWREVPPADLAHAQAFYPAVGLALGMGLAALDALLGLWLPPAPRAALLVATLAMLTRGLHLDGLADSCDGLFGGSTPERRLEIMRDPRTGSFGVTALVLVLLLQWSAIITLPSPWRWAGLTLFPAAGRFGMVVTAAAIPYARPAGLGLGFHRAARGLPLAVAGLTVVGAAVVLFGILGPLLLLPALLVAAAWSALARRLIGGATGDLYGASCEVSQALTVLAVVAWAGRAWPVPWLPPALGW